MEKIIHNRYQKLSYIETTYGIEKKILQNLSEKDLLRFITRGTRIRYYDIRDIKRYIRNDELPNPEIDVCYAHINKSQNKQSLVDKTNYFKTNFPSCKIITEISDDLMRPKLVNLIDQIYRRQISALILYDDKIPCIEEIKLVTEKCEIDLLICHP